MSKALARIIQEHSNDYSALERAYHAATGCELVREPFLSPQHPPREISLSASVVIPARNAQDTIAQCLIAIEQSSFNRQHPDLLQVVVVDDGSTDATWERLTALRLDLNLQAVKQAHLGRAPAMNTGISIAEGDVIISCDSDIVLCPFSIEELVKRHQLLKKVLLVGFRCDVDGRDSHIRPSALRENMASLFPRFDGDNRVRFHWPGWPENMCAESDHLKRLGHGKRFWVNDGEVPDGDSWDLPRMVYGALFSLRSDDLKRIGGYDERFIGWGWEDTALGARAIALDNVIVPVYSAIGLHIAHADRSPSKWQEANANYHLLLEILRSPQILGEERVFTQARKRILDQVGSSSPSTRHDIPVSWSELLGTALNHRDDLGAYLHHLGRYVEAADVFGRQDHDEPDRPWRQYHQGRSLRAAGHCTEAIRVLKEAVGRLPEYAGPLIELGLALAANGDFARARAFLEQACCCEPANGLLAYINLPTQLHVRRGRKHVAQGFNALARRDFEAALISASRDAALRREWRQSCDRAI